MVGNYFLGTKIDSQQYTGAQDKTAPASTVFARVMQIVLDNDTVIYDSQGARVPVGGIKYKQIIEGDDSSQSIGYALPMFSNIQQYPQENEIVLLINGPNPESQQINQYQSVYYLNTGVLNVWGTQHHNAIPQKGVDYNNPIGVGVVELADINQIYPYPGDTIIQGRLGQSIRISGYKSKYNTFTDSSNDAKPIMLFSNGQIKTDNGIDCINEDINQDANSIYFLSDHKVPLTPANTKRDSYTEVPTTSDQYKGNQVVINAGRLYFNAKEESILMSAKQSIGLNANTLNLDASDYFCVDANKIYLGKKARTATRSVQQPAVLGKQLENWLTALLNTLDIVAIAMTTSTAVGAGPVTQLNAAGPSLQASIQSLKSQFTVFQSKKVFTE